MVTVEVFRDDRSNAEKALDRLRRDSPDIDRKLRVMFARQIVGHVQKDYLRGQVLHRISGDLAASISHRDFSQHETMVGSYGVVYARIHELGGIIRAKNGKYLCFPSRRGLTRFSKTGKLMSKGRSRRVEWGWVRVKQVTMPARPYLLPGIQTYFSSGTAEHDAEIALQHELDKRENG